MELDGRDRPNAPILSSLSERERQLLLLASQGFTDNAIATKLGISLATVGTYWGRVRIKIGPLNRTELVAVFLKEQAADAIQRLKDENAALLRDIERHAQNERVLKSSLEMFRSLVESAPDGIVMVNSEGRVELANREAEKLFGYGHDEMLGMRVEQLMPERYRSEHPILRAQYLENPLPRRMGEHYNTAALRRDGTEFVMATALSATNTAHGVLVTCIIRDVTDEVMLGESREQTLVEDGA